MKTITLEEHFVTESFLKATGAYGNNAPPQLALIQPKLLDLGFERIAATSAPTNPSLVTHRSSSFAALCGSFKFRAANPANRVGFALTA